MGAALVLFRLVADNPSMARAMFMATHLVNTFLLLAALTLTAHFASGGAPFRLRGRGLMGGGFALGALRPAALRRQRRDRRPGGHALPVAVAGRRPSHRTSRPRPTC